MNSVAATLALLCLSAICLAGPLDSREKGLLEWVDAHNDDAVSLLKETVDIPSGTLNVTGVRDVGRVYRRELDAIGFETRWIDLPVEMQRAGHLFASRNREGIELLLIGHLDTVFEEEDGIRRFGSDGTIATGHGVYDMKAGNVVIVYALKALSAAGLLDNVSVTVALTGDEEKPGMPLSESRRELIAAGRRSDVALGFEEAMTFDGRDWATVARRSSSRWLLTVSGRQAHSSRIFSDDVGAGAVFEAARILNAFYDTVRGERHLTFNAGTIQGGTEIKYDAEQNRGTTFGKTNVVPRTVVVHGGMRTVSDEQLERARASMREIVGQNLPHTTATIEFSDGYPPMAPTEGNLRLQQALSEINVLLGREPMPALDPSKRGAADISFVAPDTDALAGLGGIGGGGHTPDEYLELSSLPLAIKRAALLIHRLGQQGGVETQ